MDSYRWVLTLLSEVFVLGLDVASVDTVRAAVLAVLNDETIVEILNSTRFLHFN